MFGRSGDLQIHNREKFHGCIYSNPLFYYVVVHAENRICKMRYTIPLRSYLRRAKSISADAFDYVLPEERIAYRPLSDRSSSKLLVVKGQSLDLQDKKFFDLPHVLPPSSLVVRNVSRVIPARLPMQKTTGGRAELMLLSPVNYIDPARALMVSANWKCFIGGRRIKLGDELSTPVGSSGSILTARILEKEGQTAVASLSLRGGDVTSLREALELAGRTPLPPYIKRQDDESDKLAYQTVYAGRDGSVAAPTAGLHITEDVLTDMLALGIQFANIILHVGAGTFAPLGGEYAGDHHMHEERASIPRGELETVLQHVVRERPVIALVCDPFYFQFFQLRDN